MGIFFSREMVYFIQLKDKGKEINEKLDMITNIVEEYRDVFSDVIREINIENSEYYGGGNHLLHLQKIYKDSNYSRI